MCVCVRGGGFRGGEERRGALGVVVVVVKCRTPAGRTKAKRAPHALSIATATNNSIHSEVVFLSPSISVC